MMHSDIKSRPAYQLLEPDLAGTGHLLVIEGETVLPGRLDSLAGTFAPVEDKLHTWLVGSHAGAQGLGKVWHLPAIADVVDAFACATRGFGIGDRLYVQGTEPFLWSVATAAGIVGFGTGQVRLHHAGSLRRRVWCTHCHGLTDNVTTNIAACSGCGRHLLVRDHFSRRLGAFMGVMIDAEVPGQIPALEEVFP
jgi:dimethylamine monooxygenase subunit C